MHGFLHKIWVVLFAFMIFGMLALVPVDKYQKSYMATIHRVQKRPQWHLDANYKYADYMEDGGDSQTANKLFVKWVKGEFIGENSEQKNFKKVPSTSKRKPYFIRDKYNPNILHPYRQ